MPLYEYVCEEDGSRIEMLRCMSEADEPVEDPEGKGRTFQRVLSSFATQSSANGSTAAMPMSGGHCCMGGSCGCH